MKPSEPKGQPMIQVEARYYVQAMLLHLARKGDGEAERQLVDLALVGLRVVHDRGDAEQIVFDASKDYPQ